MDSRYNKGLESIPVELLLEIQLFALSPHLPFVSRHFHQVFQATPPIYRAKYLINHVAAGKWEKQLLYTRVLRYPLCTQPVFEAFHALVLRRNPLHFSREENELGKAEDTARNKHKSRPKQKIVTYDIPRRLFLNLVLPSSIRTWSDTDRPLPFLRYLISLSSPIPPPTAPDSSSNSVSSPTPGGSTSPPLPPLLLPDLNANSGYALTKAVHAQFVPLVQLLLAHGASPEKKDGIAVMVAIRQRNLKLVKMLIERQDEPTPSISTASSTTLTKSTLTTNPPTESKSKSARPSTKRRKLEDRMKPDVRMLKVAVQCKAKDIVEYLCLEKGVIPDLQTLQMMA